MIKFVGFTCAALALLYLAGVRPAGVKQGIVSSQEDYADVPSLGDSEQGWGR